MTMERKEYIAPAILAIEMAGTSIMAGSGVDENGGKGVASPVDKYGASSADAPERIYFDYNYDEE